MKIRTGRAQSCSADYTSLSEIPMRISQKKSKSEWTQKIIIFGFTILSNGFSNPISLTGTKNQFIPMGGGEGRVAVVRRGAPPLFMSSTTW